MNTESIYHHFQSRTDIVPFDKIYRTLPYEKIELRCWKPFSKSDWRLLLLRNGKAWFQGTKSDQEGFHYALYAVGEFGRLCWLMDRIELAAIPRIHGFSFYGHTQHEIHVTDSKSIRNSFIVKENPMPFEFWTIWNAVLAITKDLQWFHVGENPPSSWPSQARSDATSSHRSQ